MVTIQDKLTIILNENAIEVEDFANCLGITQAQATALIEGKKKLTSTLARQIEQTFSKPKYWLGNDSDSAHEGPNFDLFG